MKNKAIKWDQQAVQYLAAALRYIQKDSPQNAENLRNEILAKISDLSRHPEIYPPDKYKQNNTGNYRAFELYHYRISYLVRDEEIIIARIRHTGQAPQDY